MATALGMSQAELTGEQQNVADANAMIMSGLGDVGSAVGKIDYSKEKENPSKE